MAGSRRYGDTWPSVRQISNSKYIQYDNYKYIRITKLQERRQLVRAWGTCGCAALRKCCYGFKPRSGHVSMQVWNSVLCRPQYYATAHIASPRSLTSDLQRVTRITRGTCGDCTIINLYFTISGKRGCTKWKVSGMRFGGKFLRAFVAVWGNVECSIQFSGRCLPLMAVTNARTQTLLSTRSES